MKKKNEDVNEIGFIITAIVVTLVIIALWFLTYLLLKDLPINERGTIGDMFGSINALFSGLALAGIILTILLQRNELKLQRTELSDTRKEFETQNSTLKVQRFENTFFNLLNLHHQIVNAIDYRYYKLKEKNGTNTLMDMIGRHQTNEEKEIVVINGRDVFRFRYNQMFESLKYKEGDYEKCYLVNYEKAQTDFGHYFRNLYRMIKLVDGTNFFYDDSKVTEQEIFNLKYSYTSIIRAQLSDFELLWIFYNCLSENGIEKFKPLIEKYSLLKNLPKKLVAFESHLCLYNQKAFNPKESNKNVK
jgi:hypothetical protein